MSLSKISNSKIKQIALIVLFSVIMSISVSANQVYYDITESAEGYEKESTVYLECEEEERGCPTSRWAFSWSIPENSEVVTINDSYGEIDTYEISNDLLHIETNTGPRTTNETIRIKLEVEEPREDLYSGLEERRINLPSYEGSKTSGVIRSENLITSSMTQGFDRQISSNEITFEGEGPTEVLINAGEGDEEEIYQFFGDKPDKEINISEIAYQTAYGVTNREISHDHLPVVLMRPVTYDQEVGRWSSGQFSDNRIKIRNDLEERLASVLAHETAHAINHEVMEWDQTSSTYLDEGLATYTEFLVDKRLYHEGHTDRRPANLFGSDITYTERERDKIRRYEVPSRGEKEELWQYYEEDRDFMEDWHPQNSENRDFGYAYSQLIIKNYLVEGGNLSNLYDNLEDVSVVGDSNQKWSQLENIVDLEPCNYENRTKFEECLDEINNYDYEVLAASSADSANNELEVESIDLPEREPESEIINERMFFDAVLILEEISFEIKNILEELKTEIKLFVEEAR